MKIINFGGFLPLSLSDWPGKPTSLVFLRGCPLKCLYCHNQWLQGGSDPVPTEYVALLVNKGVAQVPRVVFSGGEPLMQAEALKDVIEKLDPKVEIGIETSGIYPGSLTTLLSEGLIDTVFLDIKAHAGQQYSYVTGGVMDGQFIMEQVMATLFFCKESKVPVYARTTIYQGYPDEVAIQEIKELANCYNVSELKVQEAVMD